MPYVEVTVSCSLSSASPQTSVLKSSCGQEHSLPINRDGCEPPSADKLGRGELVGAALGEGWAWLAHQQAFPD